MRSKQKFWLNLLSYLALFIGVLYEYWGIATTLFYFVIESSINCGIAAYWFKRDGKKKAGIIGSLAGGFGAAILTLNFAYMLSFIAKDVSFDIANHDSPRLAFFIEMLIYTWPLIIYKGVSSYLIFRKLDKIETEKQAWSEAIHSIMSIFIAFGLTIVMVKVAKIDRNIIVLSAILIARILFDLYLYREILGMKVKKK
jgi:hypothetical protein